MFVHRMTSESVAAPCDEVFDYLVAGASGPAHVLRSLSPRQARFASHARATVSDTLGADYTITVLEPVRRIDFRTASGLLRFRGMLLLTPGPGGSGTDLTVYLAKDHGGLLSAVYAHRFSTIVDKLERFPAVAAHPSWPGSR